tara:strand:- start:600 stop:1649 length:1050 start_codon:yes stop_codon:yes gene_type:complete
MEKNKPQVTVLTLVYNGIPFIKESIDSTLSQTYKDFKFLILDDASPDPNVSKLIQSYDDKRIEYVRNTTNLGVSDSFNKALQLIDTTYTIRIDQDDINTPNRIKEQIEFLQNNKNISIICSWEHTIDSEGNLGRDWKRSCKNYGEFIGPVLLCICPIWHPSIAFKTQDMIEAGGFKKEYTRAEDFEVTARMAFKRYEASIIPSFHLYQRQHESSQSKEFESEQTKMANKIQKEILIQFLETDDVEELSSFLRIEQSPYNLSKMQLSQLSQKTRELLNSVKRKKKLNSEEYTSLYMVFIRRLGLGFMLEKSFSYLPEKLYVLVFLIFSPQLNNKVKTNFKKIYNYLTNSN